MKDILEKNNIELDTEEIQVIVFKLGNEEYGMSIASVQEIIVPQKYTRIPKSPKSIKGVINLRGNIIPVLDGRVKFNIFTEKSNSSSERIMIVENDGELIGLIVDSVAEVLKFKVTDLEPPPLDFAEVNELFRGIGRFDDRLIIVLNQANFLKINEESGLGAFKNVTNLIKNAQAL